MGWRLEYWRGSVRLRTTTIDDIPHAEVAAYLSALVSEQLDREYLRAYKADTPHQPVIRTNRNGTKLWTTGKDFHYTAQWFRDDAKPTRE